MHHLNRSVYAIMGEGATVLWDSNSPATIKTQACIVNQNGGEGYVLQPTEKGGDGTRRGKDYWASKEGGYSAKKVKSEKDGAKKYYSNLL